MNRLHSILVAGCVIGAALALPHIATAQGTDGADARLHWGPLSLDPKIAISNVGVDSNVFYSANNPEKDFNISAGPQLDEWLRIGRVFLSGTTDVSFTYYQKATSQRSTDFGQRGRVEVRFVPFTPHVSAAYANSRQRPNAEIDVRVPHTTTQYAAGVLVPIGSRTSLDFEAMLSELNYHDDAIGGPVLSELLDRETRGVNLKYSFEYSPLTTFVVRGELRQDRFHQSPIRDSNAVNVIPGVEFTRDALLSGSAYVGFKVFQPRDGAVPDYTGVVADVALRYTARETMKMAFNIKRDIEYSLDPLTPYYVSTGGNVTIHQGIGGGWDVMGKAGLTRLGYRSLEGLENAQLLNRTDDTVDLGTGIGKTLGNGIRLGFEFTHSQRKSDLPTREYAGYRAGGTVSYGF